MLTHWPSAGTVEYALSAGQRLIRQGESLRHVAVIKVGLAALRWRRDPDSGRAVAVTGPGQAIGLRALALVDTAALEVVAVNDVRVCAHPVDDGQLWPPRTPAVIDEGVRLVETLADWAAIGRLPSAMQRVEATLHRLAQAAGTARVELPGRDLLADLAACAPETVSRAIAALVQAGRL